MAIPAQTTTTPSRIGIREDLDDWVSNIDPTETPFCQAIGSSKADQHFTEWQIDNLVDATGDNKALEGDDLANENRPATSRVGNYTQIMTKVVGTSTRARAVNTAGRADEHNFQLAKAAKELKRDKEVRFFGNYAAVPGTDSTEGETAGALAWLTTNNGMGGGGTAPTLSGGTGGYPNAAAGNGTTRPLTEALLKEQVANAWNAGGTPTMAIMGLELKQTAAAFAGLAQQRRETGNKKATIVAGADVYVSDVGEIQLVPSRFTFGPAGSASSGRDVLIIDPSLWSESTLEPSQRRKLATTGLADRMAMYCDKALRCHNEAGNSVIRDVTPS